MHNMARKRIILQQNQANQISTAAINLMPHWMLHARKILLMDGHITHFSHTSGTYEICDPNTPPLLYRYWREYDISETNIIVHFRPSIILIDTDI